MIVSGARRPGLSPSIQASSVPSADSGFSQEIDEYT